MKLLNKSNLTSNTIEIVNSEVTVKKSPVIQEIKIWVFSILITFIMLFTGLIIHYSINYYTGVINNNNFIDYLEYLLYSSTGVNEDFNNNNIDGIDTYNYAVNTEIFKRLYY